jgi:hypothetical protein
MTVSLSVSTSKRKLKERKDKWMVYNDCCGAVFYGAVFDDAPASL